MNDKNKRVPKILTGEAKEDFKKWLRETPILLTGEDKENFEKWLSKIIIQGKSPRYNLPFFYTLSPSLQYGVYLDFRDWKKTKAKALKKKVLNMDDEPDLESCYLIPHAFGDSIRMLEAEMAIHRGADYYNVTEAEFMELLKLKMEE